MKIYTKGGDKGTTSLIGGKRVGKSDPQVEVYGQIDELNAWIGLLAAEAGLMGASTDRGANTPREEGKKDGNAYENRDSRPLAFAGVCGFLTDIQQDLFKIGGFYSFDFSEGKPYPYHFMEEASVERLEKEIDRMQAGLPELKAFILPGGCPLAARTHVARTVCRRVERCMDGFGGIPEAAQVQGSLAKAYINRLSDYLFVLARFFQHQSGLADVLL